MVYVFLADGFEEIEAVTTIDILRRAELDVRIAGVGGRLVRGAHGITVCADAQVEELDTGGVQMIVLPGGMPGTLHLERSESVSRMIDYAAETVFGSRRFAPHPRFLDIKACCMAGRPSAIPVLRSSLQARRSPAAWWKQTGRILRQTAPAQPWSSRWSSLPG